MFFRKKEFGSGKYDFIIAGLGNPGAKYEMTRHNAGFLSMDLLSIEEGVDIKKLKHHALCADMTVEGKKCLVMKPQTMMNASGEAIGEAAKYYKVPAENVIVVYDDISLDVGRNAKVAAGGVVVKDVEPNCTVVGVPGEVVRIDGERVDDLDQINIPDPLMNLIRENQAEIEKLKEEIEKLKEQK